MVKVGVDDEEDFAGLEVSKLAKSGDSGQCSVPSFGWNLRSLREPNGGGNVFHCDKFIAVKVVKKGAVFAAFIAVVSAYANESMGFAELGVEVFYLVR